MDTHNWLGREGEAHAFRYVEEKLGMRLLERNWSFNHKEVDLIATDEAVLVFFEVKTRSEDYRYAPALAVDRKKRMNICFAANYYSRMKQYKLPLRFDILSVVYRPATGLFEIEHIPNAFRPEPHFYGRGRRPYRR